jgi:hypothetical protein
VCDAGRRNQLSVRPDQRDRPQGVASIVVVSTIISVLTIPLLLVILL